jgi:hypothetical protein
MELYAEARDGTTTTDARVRTTHLARQDVPIMALGSL